MKRRALALVVAVLVGLLLLGVGVAKALSPIQVARVFNTAANANTNLVTSFTPQTQSGISSAYRVTIALKTTDSVLELQIVNGGTTVEADLNNGDALTAGKLYTFTFGASRSETFNLHVETATTIGYLLIEEIKDGAL
jgi:hypothetical protein